MDRTELMELAREAITERGEEYGEPENIFTEIAYLWSWLFGQPIKNWQVALAMDLMKSVRAKNNPGKVDTWVDKIGYSANGGEVATSVQPDPFQAFRCAESQ